MTTATPVRAGSRRRPTAQLTQPPSAYEEQLRLFSTALTVVGILALWFAAQVLFLGSLSQDREQALLHDRFRSDLAAAVAPVGPVVPERTPVSLLTVPGLGLEQVVVEGTSSGALLSGPGHRRDTPLPGQVGTSVIYGKGATYGAPFGRIAELSAGDRIEVVAGQGTQVFTVTGIRRAGDPLPAPPVDQEARLTLVSAEGTGRLAALSRGEVVYVDASAKEGFPAPAGRFGAVPEEERAMAVDQAILPRLALLLGLLVGATALIVLLRQRWSGVLTWVVATPVVLALSWATTDAAMRLLPNLV